MVTRLRPRSVYDILGAIAFFVVIAGGGAYAAATIGASDIRNDAVRSYHIKDGQVTHADLAANSVGNAKESQITPLSRADFKAGALPLGALSFDRHLDAGEHPTVGPIRGLVVTLLCATASDVHVGLRFTPADGSTPIVFAGTQAIDKNLSNLQGVTNLYNLTSSDASADANFALRLSTSTKWVRFQLAAGYAGSGCNFGGLITPLSQ
jgi:hypothetical protein